MRPINKFMLVFISVVFTLACGLISNPLSQAQNLVTTAQAFATSMPVQTLQALGTSMPDVSQYLNPVGTPVSTWNNIPIMTQATAGQQFNQNTYSFKASGVSVADVQAFYNQALPPLGWTSAFSAQGGTSGGTALFTKGTNVVSITVTAGDSNNFVVILVYQ